MIDLDTVYNEDCLEGMKRIPDGSIDCIICDLPYGTTRNKWDSVLPLDRLWTQYRRVAKPNAAMAEGNGHGVSKLKEDAAERPREYLGFL